MASRHLWRYKLQSQLRSKGVSLIQTFLPYPDFVQTAKCLDNKRLGKQRVEAYQILRVLAGLTKGWRNHPAVLMWRGYEPALNKYGLVICDEWKERGFADTLSDKFHVNPNIQIEYPSWIGNKQFHESHASNLVRKFPEHYRQYFPDIDDTLPYYWATKQQVVV